MATIINEVVLASDLADMKVNEVVLNDSVNYPNYNSSKDLVEYDEDNMLVYKSEIQKVFDYWYIIYYDLISKNKILK